MIGSRIRQNFIVMKRRYYAESVWPDVIALYVCIRKAMDLANADKDIVRIVLYNYTKDNILVVNELFGERNVKKMFSAPLLLEESSKPFVCATTRTYKKLSKFVGKLNDIVICCHMDSEEVFKIDQFKTAKYVIALSWSTF